jgi:hypothetical protein
MVLLRSTKEVILINVYFSINYHTKFYYLTLSDNGAVPTLEFRTAFVLVSLKVVN